jgi:hypothetical protein
MGAQDESTGYKRPPRHSRFKPGQSGNPNGRPKGRKNKETLLERLLFERYRVQLSEGKQTLSAFEIVCYHVRKKALSGERAAVKNWSELMSICGVLDKKQPEEQPYHHGVLVVPGLMKPTAGS